MRLAALPALPAIHLRRIEHPFVITEGERQRRAGSIAHNGAIEARSPPGVARAGAGLLDLEPQHVLIAINAYLGDTHNVTGGLAFLPKRLTRAAVEPSLASGDRSLQRLRIHARDHQHRAGLQVGDDTGDEAAGVEFRREGLPLLDLLLGA